MPSNNTEIIIQVEGMDEIIHAFDEFPRVVEKYLGAAGKEAADNVLLNTEGLRNYPPLTSANRPPYPYYERNLGTWTSPEHNLKNSEHLGQAFYVEPKGFETIIGNKAEYAPFVVGKKQAKNMRDKGWKKLYETAKEKITPITRVYREWINKMLKDIDLL